MRRSHHLGGGAPAQPGQTYGVRMASPQFLREQQAHAAAMSNAQAAGDMALQAQAYQQKRALINKVFGGRNPYNAMRRYSRIGTGFGGQPVYSDQQQQQLINSGVAQNNQHLASSLQDLRGSLAGKGFSANSPLWQALMSQRQAANAASNADVRRQIPLEIAQANASHQLNSRLAAEEIRSRRWNDQMGLLTSLLGVL